MNYFSSLPKPLATGLLYASSGKYTTISLGHMALNYVSQAQQSSEQKQTLMSLAMELLLMAWECDPNDVHLATQLSQLIKHHAGNISAERRAFLNLCAQEQETQKKQSPVHLWHAACEAWQNEDWSAAYMCLKPLFAYMPLAMERAGHCLVRTNRHEEAFALWQNVLALRPWHTQLQLTLHDYAQGLHEPLDAPMGPTAVLIYTWNKAHDLDALLASLQDSFADVTTLVCLDNGSTDATPQVLRRWQEVYGSAMHVHTLPVNIGAPAARNWLAQLPEVTALPFAAYVDDDALLPAHWLRSLGRAQREYPHAYTWGCHIVDAGNAHISQCGPLHLEGHFAPQNTQLQEYFLPSYHEEYTNASATEPAYLPADQAFSPLLAKGEPFGVRHALCSGEVYGSLSYMRPCASVTGCCHLFRSEDLIQQPFNISFSPSQRDDQHRDLLCVKEGKMAVYTGFCTVQHQKRSGLGITNAAAYGNALGNVYKLYGQFSAQDIENMLLQEIEVLQDDLTLRRQRLHALNLLPL